MIAPVHSLGPGERVCLWTQGCSKHCSGCISPELQSFRGERIDDSTLSNIVIRTAQLNSCDGLTISGGDPFEQADALHKFLRSVRNKFNDILVYTGYELSEIKAGRSGFAGIECLSLIDVLIDGKYVDSLNEPYCVLRGSKNQTIHFFNKALEKKYSEYMNHGRIIESFSHNDTIIVTGIPNRRSSL